MAEALRTYPDLNAAAIKDGCDLSLRLWYLLRQGHPGGHGWLPLPDVYNLSCGNRRQTRRWLCGGAGVFWHKDDRGRLWLHSLAKVSLALDVKPKKAPVAIPRGDIENLAQFRAALYMSWFADAGEEGRVISQAALSDIFGRTSRTLRTWAKAGGLGVVHNIALAPTPKPGDDLDRYPSGTLEAMGWGKTWLDDPDQKPNLVWFERHDDNLVLVWKMANTYVCTLTTGPKTTLQKEAAKHVPDKKAAGTPVKLYYRQGSDGRTIARAMQRRESLYLETGTAHPKTGERVWSYLA